MYTYKILLQDNKKKRKKISSFFYINQYGYNKSEISYIIFYLQGSSLFSFYLQVRWADLEERKEQEKMRAVGFVVGHTNWDRMMDPTKGGSALTRTKYI